MTDKVPNLVPVSIDGIEHHLPEGMNLVDAVKTVGIDIPVFCYHPKLGYDGNCRMCLVELGTPRPNRETGETEIGWFPTLQISCAQNVSSGMAIRTTTDRVVEGRREILEFLLSSHPLDCPICDKGGECPLQNLTMRHGPGTSRMYWSDKMRLGKHVPLGELIYLDQERCIHCARCIRFQEKIAGDPVLGFDYRGRKQQIITHSEPGFDSIWSGNTTDICPVGALTTADFRFNARPWEMVQVGSLDSYTPEGANITFDTRIDREAGGRSTIRRVMPRQNEWVNEIWIHDKTRLGRHYMDHPDRLTLPLIRKGGTHVETSWEDALEIITARLKDAGGRVAALAGPRLSNEDYYALQKLVREQGSSSLAAYPAHSAGAEFVASAGVGVGTSLGDLGEGDAILVAATDLHEEAPIWWLRVKQAAERGATLIVLNGRETRLDRYADHLLHYPFGEEVASMNALLGSLTKGSLADVEGVAKAFDHARSYTADKDAKAAAKAFAEAANAVALVGSEGLNAAGSHALAGAAANLALATGHAGRPNNGLIVVWAGANLQGAYDMGFSSRFGPGYVPVEAAGLDYEGILKALGDNKLDVLFIAGADPAFDDAHATDLIGRTQAMVVVTEMFLTDTAHLADVILPVQSIAEREGSYTSGERRVQRFYQAIEPVGESKADWNIAALIARQLGGPEPFAAASQVFAEMAGSVPQYAGLNHRTLAETVDQLPDVGGDDLYFGGTAFQNQHGIGVQWASAAESGRASAGAVEAPASLKPGKGQVLLVPVSVLYDREALFSRTDLLHDRVARPYVAIHPADAARLGVMEGDLLHVEAESYTVTAPASLRESAPPGVAIIPRRLGRYGAPPRTMVGTISVLEKAGV